MTSHTQRLNLFIQRHLPAINAIGLSIEQYDEKAFRVSLPMDKNHNDKYTAFGGSLYNLCLMNCIGLAFLKCFERGINPDLVVAEANIKYLKAVKGDVINSVCQLPTEAQWDAFFDAYAERGRAKMPLTSGVYLDDVKHEENQAVAFSGLFALIGESDTTKV